MSTDLERLKRLSEAARASRDAYQDDREARDKEIEVADTVLHASQREIAKAAGLSSAGISKILLKQKIARQQGGS